MTNRSSFGNHMYVFAEGLIFDACAGPELGTKEHVPYLRSVIDSSTDEELLPSFFSPYGFPQLQRVMQFRNRNYQLE